MIRFECPSCGKTISVRDEYAGKKGPCPQCKHVLRVPSASDAPDPGELDLAALADGPAVEEPASDPLRYTGAAPDDVPAPWSRRTRAAAESGGGLDRKKLLLLGGIAAAALVLVLVVWSLVGDSDEPNRPSPANQYATPGQPKPSAPATPPVAPPKRVTPPKPAGPPEPVRPIVPVLPIPVPKPSGPFTLPDPLPIPAKWADSTGLSAFVARDCPPLEAHRMAVKPADRAERLTNMLHNGGLQLLIEHHPPGAPNSKGEYPKSALAAGVDLHNKGAATRPYGRYALPVRGAKNPAPEPVQQVLSDTEAKVIIDFLAKEGFLETALDLTRYEQPACWGPTITVVLRETRGHGTYYQDWGYNAACVARLTALKGALPEAEAEELARLIEAITPLATHPVPRPMGITDDELGELGRKLTAEAGGSWARRRVYIASVPMSVLCCTQIVGDGIPEAEYWLYPLAGGRRAWRYLQWLSPQQTDPLVLARGNKYEVLATASIWNRDKKILRALGLTRAPGGSSPPSSVPPGLAFWMRISIKDPSGKMNTVTVATIDPKRQEDYGESFLPVAAATADKILAFCRKQGYQTEALDEKGAVCLISVFDLAGDAKPLRKAYRGQTADVAELKRLLALLPKTKRAVVDLLESAGSQWSKPSTPPRVRPGVPPRPTRPVRPTPIRRRPTRPPPRPDNPVKRRARGVLEEVLAVSPDKTRIAYCTAEGGVGIRGRKGVWLGRRPGHAYISWVHFTPDSEHLVCQWVLRGGWRSKKGGWERTRSAGRAITIDGIPGRRFDSTTTPVFSPDGRRMAYEGTYDIRKVDHVGSKAHWDVMVVDGLEDPHCRITETWHRGQRRELSLFNPDGRRYAYVAAGKEGEYLVVDGVAGRTYGDIRRVRWSPDGKHVAFLARKEKVHHTALQYANAVVINGVEVGPGELPTDVEYTSSAWGVDWRQTGMLCTPDWSRIAYVVRVHDRHEGIKERRNLPAYVVCNGQAGKRYWGIYRSPVFRPDGKLHYWAFAGRSRKPEDLRGVQVLEHKEIDPKINLDRPSGAEQIARIKASDSIMLSIRYVGYPEVREGRQVSGGSRPHLTLEYTSNHLPGSLTRPQAEAIVDHLAKGGFLDEAEFRVGSPGQTAHVPTRSGYVPTYGVLLAHTHEGKTWRYSQDWGLNPATIRRLEALQKVISDGEAKKAMMKMMGALKAARKEWSRGGPLSKPIPAFDFDTIEEKLPKVAWNTGQPVTWRKARRTIRSVPMDVLLGDLPTVPYRGPAYIVYPYGFQLRYWYQTPSTPAGSSGLSGTDEYTIVGHQPAKPFPMPAKYPSDRIYSPHEIPISMMAHTERLRRNTDEFVFYVQWSPQGGIPGKSLLLTTKRPTKAIPKDTYWVRIAQPQIDALVDFCLRNEYWPVYERRSREGPRYGVLLYGTGSKKPDMAKRLGYFPELHGQLLKIRSVLTGQAASRMNQLLKVVEDEIKKNHPDYVWPEKNPKSARPAAG